jgi:hypothetical protein
MATISIEIQEIGEGYIQYPSVTAVISLDGDNFLLSSMLIDQEDVYANLDILHGFTGIWECKAEYEGIDFYIDDEVKNYIKELEEEIEVIESAREEFEENLRLGDEVYWNDPEGKTSGKYKISEFLDENTVRLSDGFTELEAFLSELE